MDLFLDTSFIISLLIETEKTEDTRKFFNEASDTFITSVSVYEETFFVGIKMIAEDRLNIASSYSLRDHIKKNGYGFADTFINYMNKVFESIEIVHDTKDLKLIENVAKSCRLMPNDAVIAATCKFYGIKKLATFDNDFNRVDFLESVKAG
jgi:predicted nucleic acid-binding protein